MTPHVDTEVRVAVGTAVATISFDVHHIAKLKQSTTRAVNQRHNITSLATMAYRKNHTVPLWISEVWQISQPMQPRKPVEANLLSIGNVIRKTTDSI